MKRPTCDYIPYYLSLQFYLELPKILLFCYIEKMFYIIIIIITSLGTALFAGCPILNYSLCFQRKQKSPHRELSDFLLL